VIAIVFSSALAPSAVSAVGTFEVLLEGLSSPKGVSVPGNREAFVAQGAFGPPGPVLAYLRSGPGNGTAVEVSPTAQLVDLAVPASGGGWGIGGDRVLYWQSPDGVITPVFDIAAYQASDPDPYDLDGDSDGSNPYGLAVLPNGDALVADAQNNDVLRVGQDGTAVTVARFVPEVVSTDHLPPEIIEEFGLPPEMPAEAVPTGIAIGRDGWAYVSQLQGFPFRPGTSHVWRVNPWAQDAECSASAPNDACSAAMGGFTALIDVAINTRTNAVYVYGLAAGGVLAFEEGFATGVFPPAVLTQVGANGKRSELAAGMLSQPGGVAVARDGTVFATDGVFGNGRLVQIRGSA
jgi:hypothetical protein